jgi:hypothetical protein
MALVKSGRGSWLPSPPDDWRHPLAGRPARPEVPTTLVVAGLAVVGIGLLTWYYMGPDVKRYLKIHSM